MSYIVEAVAIYSLLVGLSLALISMVFFTLGVIASQGHAVRKDIWMMQRRQALERLRRDSRSGDT